MTFKDQAIKGSFWTLIDLLFNKAIFYISTIILARVLGPREFGLIGMITIFIAIGNSLIEGGLTTSLLRMRNPTKKDFSTVFFINIVVSIFVYLVIFWVAPSISIFYEEPQLTEVIRVYATGFIIVAFKSVHVVRLTVKLQFKNITLFNLPGNIIASTVSIYLAYHGYGVWSLVVLFILNQLISTFIFWIGAKWKPSFLIDGKSAKKHFNFGYKLMISSQLNILYDNINNILIGKFFSARSLGYYERAYTLNSYPTSIFSSILNKVTLPLLAKIKNDERLLIDLFYKVLRIIVFSSYLLCGILFLISEELIYLLLGKDWQESILIFKILVFSFMLYPIHTFNINILNLFGRSDLFLKIEVLKKIIAIFVIVVALTFGILGLVWGNVIISFFSLIINIYAASKVLKFKMKEALKIIVTNSIVLIVAILLNFIIIDKFINTNDLLQAIFKICVFLIVSIFIMEKIKLKSYYFVKAYLKRMIYDTSS